MYIQTQLKGLMGLGRDLLRTNFRVIVFVLVPWLVGVRAFALARQLLMSTTHFAFRF